MEPREALKNMRRELGLTQSELADGLHIYNTSVSRWEVGKATPQGKSIDAILNFAQAKGASEQCMAILRNALQKSHKENIRLPDSPLYPVERESICQLVDDSHNAIYVCDMETDEMLYVNHKAEQYIGKKFDPNAHEKCYSFLYGLSGPCRNCPKTQLHENDISDFHIVSSINGRNYHVNGRKLIWNGKPAHAQYFRDETDALEQQDGLHNLINTLDEGVCIYWVYDNGNIEMNYMSDGYFSIVGSSREKRTGYHGFGVTNAIVEADRQRVIDTALDAGKHKESFRITYKVLSDDGSPVELLMRAKFIRREKGKSLFHCIVIDI